MRYLRSSYKYKSVQFCLYWNFSSMRLRGKWSVLVKVEILRNLSFLTSIPLIMVTMVLKSDPNDIRAISGLDFIQCCFSQAQPCISSFIMSKLAFISVVTFTKMSSSMLKRITYDTPRNQYSTLERLSTKPQTRDSISAVTLVVWTTITNYLLIYYCVEVEALSPSRYSEDRLSEQARTQVLSESVTSWQPRFSSWVQLRRGSGSVWQDTKRYPMGYDLLRARISTLVSSEQMTLLRGLVRKRPNVYISSSTSQSGKLILVQSAASCSREFPQQSVQKLVNLKIVSSESCRRSIILVMLESLKSLTEDMVLAMMSPWSCLLTQMTFIRLEVPRSSQYQPDQTQYLINRSVSH